MTMLLEFSKLMVEEGGGGVRRIFMSLVEAYSTPGWVSTISQMHN